MVRPKLPIGTKGVSVHEAEPELSYAWRVLTVTSLGVLLSGANSSTLDVALPVVARHFHATAREASWAILGYMLVNTVMILIFGRVADIVGRRRLYQTGFAIFTASSVLLGLAPNALTLDVLRGVQGLGAAAIITNTTALLGDAFPRSHLSVGLGFNVTAAAAAQVVGPVVGGALASGLGWRSVFWFNVPIGVAGLIWGQRVLRPDPVVHRREPFDFLGAVMLALGLGGAIVGIAEIGATSWSSPLARSALACFVVATPIFFLLQTRRAFPLLDLGVFRNRERSTAYATAFLLAFCRFAVVLLISLYLQAATGASPWEAGVQIVPVAAGMAVTAPIAGRLARHYEVRLLATTGILVTTLGTAWLAVVLSPSISRPTVLASLLLVGVGTGMFMTPNTTSIMSELPSDRRGIANGVRSMLQNTGYLVSTAVGLAVVTTSLSAPDKSAAYSGTLVRLSPSSIGHFTHDYRIAFGILTAAGLVAAVVSAGRPRHVNATETRSAVS
jgi:EmrB/QacA subfamily drug resistance transporter